MCLVAFNGFSTVFYCHVWKKNVYTALCDLIPFLMPLSWCSLLRVLYAMAYTTLCYMFLKVLYARLCAREDQKGDQKNKKQLMPVIKQLKLSELYATLYHSLCRCLIPPLYTMFMPATLCRIKYFCWMLQVVTLCCPMPLPPYAMTVPHFTLCCLMPTI